MLQIAGRTEADVDFVARVCDPTDPGCWELTPILAFEQFLIPVSPLPDPFPPIGPECLSCPPFIEIFDIPGLDIINFQPPPDFQAQMRLLGDPDPQPNITDSPNLPNLLLIYTGPNEIAGPAELGSFELDLPPQITRLQYFAQAFDAQGSVVSNVGFIPVPEPGSIALLISGAVAGLGLARLRRRYAREAV